MDAAPLVCAHILARIDGHGLAEGQIGHHGKPIHTHDDDVGRDYHFSHGVGQRLNHHHGAGHDGLGDARRNADLHDPPGDLLVIAQGLPVQIEQSAHTEQLAIAAYRRNSLGQNGGQRNAGNLHAEARHKPQVQHHIQRRCQQQEDQRRNAVAQAPQNTREHIVHEESQNAVEIDVQVILAPVNDRPGGIQQSQHGPGNQRSHYHDKRGGNQGQRNTVADIPGQALPVSGTKGLGNHDPRTGGNPHKQGQQQVQNRGRTAHGRQGIVAHIHTHNDGIRRVIQLLGDIAQQHRNRKPQNLFPGGSTGQIRCAKHSLQTQSIINSLHNFSILFYRIQQQKATAAAALSSLPRKILESAFLPVRHLQGWAYRNIDILSIIVYIIFS